MLYVWGLSYPDDGCCGCWYELGGGAWPLTEYVEYVVCGLSDDCDRPLGAIAPLGKPCSTAPNSDGGREGRLWLTRYDEEDIEVGERLVLTRNKI